MDFKIATVFENFSMETVGIYRSGQVREMPWMRTHVVFTDMQRN